MALSVGEKLGPYEILAPIGEGGMGEVWKARDTRLVAARTPLRARSGFPVFQLPAGTPGFRLEEVAAATSREDLDAAREFLEPGP